MLIDYRYRQPLRFAIWALAILGIVVSVVALPIWLSLPFAVLSFIAGWFSDRAVYKLSFSVVQVGTELLSSQHERLGLLWSYGQYRGARFPQLSILFDIKKKAAFAYAVLRKWTFGKYIVRNLDIQVTIVREGGAKFTTIIRPGDRTALADAIKSHIDSQTPGDVQSELEFSVIPLLINPADYSERPEMVEFMNELDAADTVLLNTAFLRDESPVGYAKRCILSPIQVVHRSDLSADSIESRFCWEDPRDVCPELVERLKSINLNQNI